MYITDYITSVISQGIYVDQYEVISSEKIQEYFKNLKGAPLNAVSYTHLFWTSPVDGFSWLLLSDLPEFESLPKSWSFLSSQW